MQLGETKAILIRRVPRLFLLLALLIPALALAEIVQPRKIATQVEGRVDCTTTSQTLLAADTTRVGLALHVTNGTGIVYVHSGTEAADATNSFALQQGGPITAYNDDNGVTVYTGAWTCKGKSATVTIFYKYGVQP